MWQEGTIEKVWVDQCKKKETIYYLTEQWQGLKNSKKSYTNFEIVKPTMPKNQIRKVDSKVVLGKCPVASEKTVCCNLQTLDSIKNCGLGCSYCSIQSFYKTEDILLEEDLERKLSEIEIDPTKTYHIGTGQASDSLMWGNLGKSHSILMQFARKNPNVILELKTKTNNITFFEKNDIPRNVIVTWSLNPNSIIQAEESLSASLEKRLAAAKTLSQKNILVGFHFHPMVYFENWEEDYTAIITKIMEEFAPSDVALVSFGTLTFTKKVINEIRKKNIMSKILQMPFEESAGKLSYPKEIKNKMFSTMYQQFTDWHKRVFFYLCMEEAEIWKASFGHVYQNNSEFESDMHNSYLKKIHQLSV